MKNNEFVDDVMTRVMEIISETGTVILAYVILLFVLMVLIMLIICVIKMKQTEVINVSNKRDDMKFDWIKPTIESTSNWIITDPLFWMNEPDVDKKCSG